jgi:hypothetical protein
MWSIRVNGDYSLSVVNLETANTSNNSCSRLKASLKAYLMGHSPPWEANIRLAGQEIPPRPLLLNQKLHYRVHCSSLIVRIMSQMNPLHILTPYIFKVK